MTIGTDQGIEFIEVLKVRRNITASHLFDKYCLL